MHAATAKATEFGASRRDDARQRRVGLTLAAVIIAAWLVLHVGLMFFWPLTLHSLLPALPLVVLQTWLYVGLFIIAHDCMHGSLVPFKPQVNRRIGQLCLFLYAGFSFDALNVEHHKHHRHPGTAEDPDFDEVPPHGFWHWFASFFLHYFGWKQVAIIAAVSLVYQLVFAVPLQNILLFWALPGLLSALQLFTFGTYLPHKPATQPFADRHNARTSEFPAWLSLLTCFHFGFHHEHHLHPDAPWWRLPEIKRRALERRD
ncbi:Beta-carotene ketolase (Beta-carotene oxygenase) [Bradyrhizobium sp. ORS 278]|uniref:fatty acid desaturase n=1 Tax=Bradyrhizobium sp. (strain ORS 278) TaxID=114615 RepID=UPI00000BB9A9|nr:fatty acid desaturase [Bradyrhizobium sp. ORS 278]AAF78203.1 beta-carotene ketolase [Bradyrhizobium sp. ORS 278]CAL80117.1 Beta-carotene ketolase (Beta-carotene oxygenase) [Bradyrhizobium sp. ORS 278]